MDLTIQIISFFFSFLYGVFLFFIYRVSSAFFLNKNYFIKISFYLLYGIGLLLLYFFSLLLINNGIIHIYFYLFLAFGFLLCYQIRRK